MDIHTSPIGKIEIVPVRTAFRHEALNFTRWLEENIEALTDRLGFELTDVEREKPVGSFHVDLVGNTTDGSRVIIENQLEPTDHGHLGQLLTYMVNLDAKVAVWVTTEPNPLHQRVIDWLNETTGEDYAFYVVKVEAIRIADSPYAPLFTVLSRPDEQVKKFGASKKELASKELAERHHKRLAFWTQMLERIKGRSTLGINRSPSTDHWLTVATGVSGVGFNYLILKDGAGVDVYIDVGDKAKNKAIFDALYVEKGVIEAEFGEQLDWRRLDDKRASRIVKIIRTGNLNEPDTWASIQDELIETMIKFDKSFRHRLARLRNITKG
jgi:hypothetical protein